MAVFTPACCSSQWPRYGCCTACGLRCGSRMLMSVALVGMNFIFVSQYLRALTSTHPDELLWSNTSPAGIARRLQLKFPAALTTAERQPGFDLRRRLLSRIVLLQRVTTTTGVELRDGTIDRLLDAWAVAQPPNSSIPATAGEETSTRPAGGEPTDSSTMAGASEFSVRDIADIKPRCKCPHVNPKLQVGHTWWCECLPSVRPPEPTSWTAGISNGVCKPIPS